MTATNLPLINGARLEATQRSSDGVPLLIPLHKPARGITPDAVIAAALELGGDGSAAINVDGSTTPAVFRFDAPSAKVSTVVALGLVLVDGAIVEAGLGGLAALATGAGLRLTITTADGELVDLLGGGELCNHADLIAYGWRVEFLGTTHVAARLELPAPIDLGPGQRLALTVRADLSGLTAARLVALGETRPL